MTTTFDDELAAWLADGPNAAPAEVLQGVLAALPATAQRRGWRLPSWTPAGRWNRAFAAAAVIIVVIGAALILGSRLAPAAVGGPSARPSVAASARPPVGFAEIDFQLFAVAGRQPDQATVQSTLKVLQARLRSLKVAGATVSVRGADGIAVLLPVEGLPSARTVLAVTGLVQFVPLPAATYGTASTTGAPAGITAGQPLPSDPGLAPLFDSSSIVSASEGTDQNGLPVVNFNLSAGAASAFATYTAANIGNFFAITLDGIVVSAPSIQSPISSGAGEITIGAATDALAQMTRLAAILASGPLPDPLQEISVELGPSPAPGVVPSTAPANPGGSTPLIVATRTLLPGCGIEDATTQLGPWNNAARACFLNAYRGHAAAEFTTTSPTTEGDPITSIYRILGPGRV